MNMFFSRTVSAVFLLTIACASVSSVRAQHEGHTVPAKPKATPAPSPVATPARAPAASPVPTPSPQVHKHTPAPDASPTPEDRAPGPGSENLVNLKPLPLLMMTENEMGIRVGASESNFLSMGKMGSGTSWNPASSPMHMHHKQSGDWLLMFHYNTIVGMNSQRGPRGVTKLESQNWFMPMAFHKLGRGTVQLKGMFSFEPFTFPPGGSPLLFQTGETYKGQPIIDAQHPHDLFMELAASYTAPLGERGTWFAYLGYPGEPALGPTAFMHRASASENPAAVLSHHYQDSSHISFGVLTTGFTYRWFKVEGSIFNGREPDEHRYNFEAHAWNSRSARISFAPNQNWSMQVSHGLLRNPEALDPGDVRRTTASITYNKPLARGNWATSLIWGRNHENHGDEIFNLNGYVAESTVNFLDKNYLYTRLELADKNQLLRDADRALLGITSHHPSFRIGAYTFGAVRDVWNTEKISLGLGGDISFYSKPALLDAIYGQHPKSYRLFLRVRPRQMKVSDHGHGSTTHQVH